MKISVTGDSVRSLKSEQRPALLEDLQDSGDPSSSGILEILLKWV